MPRRTLRRAENDRSNSWLREAGAGVASVLACLVLMAATVTIWAHSLLVDTDHWVSVMTPIAAEPTVQAALAAYLADQIIGATGVSGVVDGALPRQPLIAGAITTAVRDGITRSLQSALESDSFQSLWMALTRAVHPRIVDALLGTGGGYLQVRGDTLWLDTTPLLDFALRWVRDRVPGLGALIASAPNQDDPADIQAVRLAIRQEIGQQLPPDFGQFALYNSAVLGMARSALRALDVLVVTLPAVALALFLATLLLTRHRLTMLAILATEIIVSFLLVRLAIESVVTAVQSTFDGETARAAAGAVLHGVFADLINFDALVLVVGLAALLLCGLLVAQFTRSVRPERVRMAD